MFAEMNISNECHTSHVQRFVKEVSYVFAAFVKAASGGEWAHSEGR